MATDLDRWVFFLSLRRVWASTLKQFPRKSMLKSQMQLSQYDRYQTQRPKEFKECRPFQIFQLAMACSGGFERRENRGGLPRLAKRWLVDLKTWFKCAIFRALFIALIDPPGKHKHIEWSACELSLNLKWCPALSRPKSTIVDLRQSWVVERKSQYTLRYWNLKLWHDRRMVRIGSKINHTNKANPRKTTTSSNYSQVPESVGWVDWEDSTVLLL